MGRPVVIEHKGDRHPQVIIEDGAGKILDVHYLPAKARIEVNEGQQVQAGELLARQPEAAAVRRILPAVCRVLPKSLRHASPKNRQRWRKSAAVSNLRAINAAAR